MTHLAVAISTADTDSALAALGQVAGQVDLAEIRLDLMQSFDLPRLLAQRSVPVIITCRPVREGGRWHGDEAERLAILRQAASLGAEYVDLEWDVASELDHFDRSRTQIILSRHDLIGMPVDLVRQADVLWPAGPDIVKVVGMAQTLTDCLPVLRVLQAATRPTIAIAMGPAGLITRLLAFRYANSFLTFAAPNGDAKDTVSSVEPRKSTGTAPGQLAVSVMKNVFRVSSISNRTRLIGLVMKGANTSPLLTEGNRWLARTATDAVLLPLELNKEDSLASDPEAIEELAPFLGYVTPEPGQHAILCRRFSDNLEEAFHGIIEAVRWLVQPEQQPDATT